MSENRNRSLLSTQSWRNMSQSIVTAVCNVSGAAYSRLHLNAVAKRVLPEHTRDALFQLFCDARTNTPKDQVFFMRHAEALKPHTFTGWLAMLAALLYSASGFALFSVGALGLMATVAFTSIFFAVIGGIIFATFVGVVATTLSLASIGLVAVASGAGTTAAAGYLTFNFWKIVFQRLGFVRQRAHLTSSGQQALPTSSHHTYTTGDTGRSSSGLGQSQTPGYTSLSSGTLGENTRQPTHNKLTTEPAKDPLKKDISIGDDESSDIFGKSASSASSLGANSTGTSEGVDSAFGSAISQDSNVRDFMEGALTNKPSKQTQGGSPSDPSPRESPFKTSGSTGSNGQNSSSLTGSQGGPPSQTHGGIKNAGQKDGVSSQDKSPFKTGGVAGSGKGSSTVTTGAPPLSQKQATNDQDINDIFGKGGSHAAPNTVQTGGGPGQRSGQGSTQSGGQKTSQTGGQSASKPSSGTPSSDSPSSGSAATNFGQAGNDSDISDLFSKGGSHTAQSSANPFSGLNSSGLPSSGPRDSSTESSGPQDSRSSGPSDSGTHASGRGGSGARSSGPSGTARPDSNKPTNDSNINAIFGKPATPNGQNASRGSSGPNGGQSASRESSGPNDSAFSGDFGGFGRQDIGLQSNFRGPTGQQGPQGSSGPRGSSRHY